MTTGGLAMVLRPDIFASLRVLTHKQVIISSMSPDGALVNICCCLNSDTTCLWIEDGEHVKESSRSKGRSVTQHASLVALIHLSLLYE